MRKWLKNNYFNFNPLILVIVLIISIAFLSRAFILGSLTGLLFLISIDYRIRTARLMHLYSVIVICGTAAILAFFVKSDSTLGRILIYKISWTMLVDQPITGVGLGEFEHQYGFYQATYFKSNIYTEKEFLLADNVYFAFNDYWQLIVETGIIGSIFLVFSIGLVIWATYNSLKLNPNDNVLKMAISTSIVLGVAALFTHVLSYKVFVVIGTSSLIYIFLASMQRSYNVLLKSILLVTLGVTVILYQYSYEINNYYNYQVFAKARLSADLGYIKEARKLYAVLYPKLRQDTYFLRKYSDVFNDDNSTKKRLFLLKEISKKRTDNLLYLNIGYCYESLGMNKEAEEAFLMCVNIVPNRFIPRKVLYDFYCSNKEFEKARIWQKTIIQMPVKIPSETINRIKESLKDNAL